jgi:hypothetical protein
MATCSFCGLSEDKVGELLAPDPTNAAALQAARICGGCVRLCAGAVSDQDGVIEEDDHQESAPAGATLAVLVEWTPFQFDGLDLEWHAIRTNTYSVRPLNLVTVRRADGVQTTLQFFQHTPTTEDVKIAAGVGDTPLDQLAHAPRERHSGEDGTGLTWTSEPAAVVEVKPNVMVSVRRHEDQGGGTAVELPWDRTPTQRDAEFAAQLAWSTLTKKA